MGKKQPQQRSSRRRRMAVDPFQFNEPFRSNNNFTRLGILREFYTSQINEWAMTRFKWSGIPFEIDVRFVEKELHYNDIVLFYLDPRYDKFIVTRAASRGMNNIYDNPTSWRTIDYGYYRGIELNSTNAVPIFGTYSRLPQVKLANIFGARLADTETSLSVNTKNMRFNKIAVADESARLTVTNALRQIENGEPTIFIKPNFNLEEAIKTLDISTEPKILEILRIEKNQIFNECATALGITNANQDKKERLVAAEAKGSDGLVLAARNNVMKPRLEACERINRMFGLNIKVEWAMEANTAIGVNNAMEMINMITGNDKNNEE